MRILHLIHSADPRLGGPINGIVQRGLFLARRDHVVDIASLDDPGSEFLKGFPVRIFPLGGGSGKYGFSARFISWLRENCVLYDAVVINGVWRFNSFGAWRVLREKNIPYFVFPHGMLDPWFRRKYKIKFLGKLLYWLLAERKVIRDARAVIFTSDEEKIAARRSFWPYKCNETVGAYGSATPDEEMETLKELFYDEFMDLREKRVVLFLGRIHEKKGCDLLINAFSQICDSNSDLHLVIAGPDDCAYGESMKRLVARAGIDGRVTWAGMLKGRRKWAAFCAADVFVLPSHQENFGIAVTEALACGCPVLISNKVNIWREIEAAHAGLVGEDTVDGTKEILTQWLNLDKVEQSKMRRNAVRVHSERFTIKAMADDLLRIVEIHS